MSGEEPVSPLPRTTGPAGRDRFDGAGDAAQTHRALLAHLRHELRTPLNAIIGYSEMLLDEAVEQGGDGVIADLRRIHAAGHDLLTRVNDALDATKIEAGTLGADLEIVGATLRHDLRTPITAVIGYGEMLLDEAAEHGQKDRTTDLERINSAAQRFLVLIDDVVHVATAGRDVTSFKLESTGTPAMMQDVVSAMRSLSEGAGAMARADRGALLVVDDNAGNRDLLSRRLERQGHAVTAAVNGRQALAMLTAQPFDLVLLDVMMPGLTGIDVLQLLKADPALRNLPVIMISALDEIDSVVRCIALGAEDYLTKPFNPVLLRARVGACLEKKRLRDHELDYLRTVARVTDAAAAVEAGTFTPVSLESVADRVDALGQLARVFQRMAREVRVREERLHQQVHDLRIQIDEVKKAREVAAITETEYFRTLQDRARRLRVKEQSH